MTQLTPLYIYIVYILYSLYIYIYINEVCAKLLKWNVFKHFYSLKLLVRLGKQQRKSSAYWQSEWSKSPNIRRLSLVYNNLLYIKFLNLSFFFPHESHVMNHHESQLVHLVFCFFWHISILFSGILRRHVSNRRVCIHFVFIDIQQAH